MVITPYDSSKEIEKKIEALNSGKSGRAFKKKIDWSKYFGKVKFAGDPVALQRQLRDE